MSALRPGGSSKEPGRRAWLEGTGPLPRSTVSRHHQPGAQGSVLLGGPWFSYKMEDAGMNRFVWLLQEASQSQERERRASQWPSTQIPAGYAFQGDPAASFQAHQEENGEYWGSHTSRPLQLQGCHAADTHSPGPWPSDPGRQVSPSPSPAHPQGPAWWVHHV